MEIGRGLRAFLVAAASAAARAWLDGPGAKSVLEAKDSWKTK